MPSSSKQPQHVRPRVDHSPSGAVAPASAPVDAVDASTASPPLKAAHDNKLTSAGRAVAALPLETPSSYQAIVSTFAALGPIASGSTKTLGQWGKHAYTQLASRRRGSLSVEGGGAAAATPSGEEAAEGRAGAGDEEDSDEQSAQADAALAASIHHRPSKHDDAIVWSAWDSLPGDTAHATSTRVLVQLFASGRLRLWEAAHFAELHEVLSIDCTALREAASDATPVCARFLPGQAEHVMAILYSNCSLVLYSTSSHTVVGQLILPGASHASDFQVNERFLVVATIQPLLLHVIPLDTLEPAPFSPITDIAAHPYDLTPVYSLSGSRMLAYASSFVPSYGGSGIIATSGWNDVSTSTGGTVGQQAGSPGSQAYDVGEKARRWGEGMMSGMKAVTDYGYSRYYGHTQATSSGSTGLTPPRRDSNGRQPSPASVFSKSAPHSSSVAGHLARSPEHNRISSSPGPSAGTGNLLPSQRAGSTALSAHSTVVVLDLVASLRSFVPGSATAIGHGTTRSRSPASGNTGLQNGLMPIAHFRPSKNHRLTLLSINPNGTLILTSSSEGHSFHIFELRPPTLIGSSSARMVSPSRKTGHGHRASSIQLANPVLKVWHRYRLNRGLTVARTVSAHWSPDSRFVAVSTTRGTVHAYPVNPLGGKPTPDSHIAQSVQNAHTLMPLSVTVNALARVKAPRIPAPADEAGTPGSLAKDTEDGDQGMLTSPPGMSFVPLEHLPTQPHASAHRTAKSSTQASRAVPLALFYPHLHSVLLTKLQLTSSPKTAPSTAPLSTRVTSQAVSGLTQMMRNKGSSLPTFESEALLARQEWLLQWPLADRDASPAQDVRVDLSKVVQKGRSATAATTSAHAAEIESFSYAPAVLPRSIYLAQSITFHKYPPVSKGSAASTVKANFSLGDFAVRDLTRVIVREEVSHKHASHVGEQWDESTELRSAMHTILDASGTPASQGFSPSSSSPAFPNGYGRSSTSNRWLPGSTALSSLPIPIGISPSTVRQAATKVRKYSANMRSPRLSAVGSGHSLQSSSLSFEDDDAVLAHTPREMLEVDEEGVDLGLPRAPVVPQSSETTFGSTSSAPIPSLSLDTGSSAESHARSSEYTGERGQHIRENSSPLMQAMHVDDEPQQEGEWDSFKLEGVDDEEDVKMPADASPKPKVPSPLLSHAMLPILAAKAEQQATPVKILPSLPSSQPLVHHGQDDSAITLASKPLPSIEAPSSDAPLISFSPGAHLDPFTSPLSSSPAEAASSSNELSASPSTAAVLGSKKKKKSKKGK